MFQEEGSWVKIICRIKKVRGEKKPPLNLTGENPEAKNSKITLQIK